MIAWLPAIWAADRADRQTSIDRLIRNLPTHGWHLRADALRLIARIVAEARPRLVLELGSGSSTVLLARQCANLSGGTRAVSVEESPLFAANTRRLLGRHQSLDRVSIIVSPVVRTRIGHWRGYCYEMSEAGIASAMAGKWAELALIDGPKSAWTMRGDCRYATLPLIGRWLANGALVIVDDAHRRRERDIIERWTAERLFEPLRSYTVGGASTSDGYPLHPSGPPSLPKLLLALQLRLALWLMIADVLSHLMQLWRAERSRTL